MRVTKTIREYIEEQVYAKAKQSANLVELEQKKDKAIKDFNEDKKNTEEMLKAYVDQFITKYRLKLREFVKPCVSFHGITEHDLPEVQEYYKVRNEIYEKARQIALDIIVEMELGGTKAELMDKLNALEF